MAELTPEDEAVLDAAYTYVANIGSYAALHAAVLARQAAHRQRSDKNVSKESQ